MSLTPFALLFLGLALFMAPHVIAPLLGADRALKARMGAGAYRGLYSLLAIGGLVLATIGYRSAPFEEIYPPLLQSRALAHALMPFAFVLVAGANMRSNLKRVVRHPMALGVTIWAALHLVYNGDLASVALFGSFAVLGLVNMFITGGRPPAPATQPVRKDVILVVAGLVAYAVVLWAHGAVFGVYVVG